MMNTENKPGRVAIYKMQYDGGFAPNPYHGYCTLALCTPNHMRCALQRGDIIIGLAGKRLAEKCDAGSIIYCMQTSEVMCLGRYYRDPRFRKKRPRADTRTFDARGDNFYLCDRESFSGTNPCELAPGGRECNLRHEGSLPEYKKYAGKYGHALEDNGQPAEGREEHTPCQQDIKGNRVFIAEHYAYFGSDARPVPRESVWGETLSKKAADLRQGVHYIYGGKGKHTWDLLQLEEFLNWFEEECNKQKNVDPIPCDLDESCHSSTKKECIDERNPVTCRR